MKMMDDPLLIRKFWPIPIVDQLLIKFDEPIMFTVCDFEVGISFPYFSVAIRDIKC